MWEVDRDDLLQVVKVLDLVSPKSGVPASDFFRLEQDSEDGSEVRFTSVGAATAEVRLRGQGKWVYEKPYHVSRRQFSPFVNLAKEITNKNTFQFHKLDKLTLKHGSRSLGFDSKPDVTGYGRLDGSLKNANILEFSSDITDLMGCAATCSSDEMAFPDTGCVYLQPYKDGLEILATNQKVGFRARVKVTIPIGDAMPFPATMIPVIGAEGLKRIKWGETCVLAKFQRGIVWQTISEIARKDFPADNVREWIEFGRDEKLQLFRVEAYEFAKTVERVTIVLQSVQKSDWVLTLSGKKGSGRVLLRSEVPGVSLKEEMECETLQKDFSVDWPLYLVAPVLQFIGKKDENKRLVVGKDEKRSMSYLRYGKIEMVIPSEIV